MNHSLNDDEDITSENSQNELSQGKKLLAISACLIMSFCHVGDNISYFAFFLQTEQVGFSFVDFLSGFNKTQNMQMRVYNESVSRCLRKNQLSVRIYF